MSRKHHLVGSTVCSRLPYATLEGYAVGLSLPARRINTGTHDCPVMAPQQLEKDANSLPNQKEIEVSLGYCNQHSPLERLAGHSVRAGNQGLPVLGCHGSDIGRGHPWKALAHLSAQLWFRSTNLCCWMSGRRLAYPICSCIGLGGFISPVGIFPTEPKVVVVVVLQTDL